MKKKIVSLLLALLLVLGTAIPASAATPFKDVPANQWYAKAVDFCYNKKLMSGTSDTTFNPNGKVTRAMMVKVLYNMDTTHGTTENVASLPFTDVPASQWYAKAVAWAYRKGITSGTSATTFSPNANITREQAATMLYNFRRTTTTIDKIDLAKLNAFSDASQTSSYAKNAMAWAITNGMISGTDATHVSPKGTATRAQLAQILMKFETWLNPDLAPGDDDTPGDGGDTEDPGTGEEPGTGEDPSTGEEPADKGPTAEEVYASMIALKDEYYEGRPWTNDNFYYWKGGIFSGGGGCAGFAFLLSDAAFGSLPARMIKPVSLKDVRVGDILRINNDTHSVIVLEVHDDHVIIAEGNYNYSIHWGRKLTKSEVESATYMMTRYPQ
ncbi:MAG: S-layer homology domain-containing protein [Acutalibacter sp.]|nr:S-layer homology domain-containing protein [Acutalibacter sp.]